jgi:hypothetical protein
MWDLTKNCFFARVVALVMRLLFIIYSAHFY